MNDNAEQLAVEIVRKLQGAGHVAYFAGGCVRDRLMGREPKDFDVATSAVPAEVLKHFPRAQQVGAAFGVIIIKRGKAQVEVATFRSDGQYSDGRRPDSVTFTTAEKDASRRDFTCNAIFFDPVAGKHFDFVGGKADIEAKLLRAVGDPAQRFAEDHLRMLRAVRFAAKLGFEMEPATLAAIVANAPKIKEISKERIGEELRMMLEHPSRTSAIGLLLHQTKLMAEIWPAALFQNSMYPFFIFASGMMSRSTAIAAFQLSMTNQYTPHKLPHDPSRVAELLQAAFVLANEEAADIAWILKEAGDIDSLDTASRARFKRLIANPRWPALWQLFSDAMVFEIGYIDSLPSIEMEEREKWIAKVEPRIKQMQEEGANPSPFVTGDDLIQLGAKPGREFKKWLEHLYDRQLELELTTREDALAAARKLIAQG